MIPSFAAEHAGGVIKDGALAVQGSRIIQSGTFTELQKQFSAAAVIGEPRHLLIPGLVNSHHHGYGVAGFSLGCRDDALEVWVPDPLRRRPVDLYLDTLYSDARLLRSGVTSVLHQGYARGGLTNRRCPSGCARGTRASGSSRCLCGRAPGSKSAALCGYERAC